MARAVRRPAAEADLLDIFVYLGRRDERAALRFLDFAEAAIDMLAEAPYLAGQRRFRNPMLAGVRAWTLRRFKNYVIYYRPTADGIEVIRVLQGSRRAEKRLLEAL